MVNSDNPARLTRRTKSTLDTAVRIVLGIEVDPTIGTKTGAELALGKPGSGHDPFEGYNIEKEYKGSDFDKEGSQFLKQVNASALDEKAVRIRACKVNVLKSYDKENGITTFKNYLTTTEEQLSEIHVFRGNRCLAGSKTFDEVKNQMKKTKPGINIILIRLDDGGKTIMDLIIDGVIHIETGIPKASTGRGEK